MTIGQRNNNPLNIRRVKGQKWKGEASPQPSPVGEGALPQGGSGNGALPQGGSDNVSSPSGEVGRGVLEVGRGVLEVGRGAAGPFVRFSSLAWGLRAAFCILRTYRNKYKAVCIEDIITRWAPPTENDTRKYICDCCKLTGFGGKERLTENDWPRLVGAMARLESGMNLTEGQIQEGFRLYRENSK